ncbi:hypothetical protein EW145_g311 [Phellinidium pouzarii]|uniref:Pentacotripeptide-repeat region of PRORP domain-containing protein n=1 Tax=Phellinidium pouzarii TaxID=167371 RepID=A0A4S4LPB0_9AGAM|nr:hypothetical protein EW145_g311 [Phellinidium pouzarii]
MRKPIPIHQSTSTSLKPKHKHKYLRPTSNQGNVRPATLSLRVKELAKQGKLEDAISLVARSPRKNNSSIVWNTLLTSLMNAGSRSRAYSVYIDMKRRQYKPTLATYVVMLRGMVGFENWSEHAEQLERCHNLYESYQEYMKAKENGADERSSESAHAPTVFYFHILGKAGFYQKLFDVFFAMDNEGPMAPNKYVYTSLLAALNHRDTTEKLGNLTAKEQNASDAKLIWRKAEKDAQAGLIEIDSAMILHILRLLANGRAADQQFGMDIVRDYIGLAPPGEDPPPPKVNLEARTFQAILELCNKANKPRVCTYFFKLLTDLRSSSSSQTHTLEIDTLHVEQVLVALNTLAAVGSLGESARAVELLHMLQRNAALQNIEGARTKRLSLGPSPSTYALALTVCWRCTDWVRACEIFELVTNLPADIFGDEGRVATNRSSMPAPTKWLNTQALANLARIALETKDNATMRQCLRMVALKPPSGHGYGEPHLAFYRVILASCIMQMYWMVLKSLSVYDRYMFRELKRRSTMVIKTRVTLERPSLEDAAPGSASHMAKLSEAVDFEMAMRF